MAKKLELSRETVRSLTPRELGEAHGAMRDTRSCAYCPPPTYYNTCTASCKASVCNSCYDSDCCLASAVVC